MKKLQITGIQYRLLFLFLIIITSCGDKGQNNDKQTNNSIDRTPQIHRVQITNMAFTPAEIYVKKGDKVIFTNNDPVVHNVTEEVSKAWTSSDLQTQQSWEMIVLKTADYYCTLHPVMKGKIIVE